MLAFGLGTMPAMIATGLSASQLAQFMNRNRLGAGLLIMLIGIATIAMPAIKMTDSRDRSTHEHEQLSLIRG
jgi:sulfite exporter TauE/SafE